MHDRAEETARGATYRCDPCHDTSRSATRRAQRLKKGVTGCAKGTFEPVHKRPHRPACRPERPGDPPCYCAQDNPPAHKERPYGAPRATHRRSYCASTRSKANSDATNNRDQPTPASSGCCGHGLRDGTNGKSPPTERRDDKPPEGTDRYGHRAGSSAECDPCATKERNDCSGGNSNWTAYEQPQCPEAPPECAGQGSKGRADPPEARRHSRCEPRDCARRVNSYPPDGRNRAAARRHEAFPEGDERYERQHKEPPEAAQLVALGDVALGR